MRNSQANGSNRTFAGLLTGFGCFNGNRIVFYCCLTGKALGECNALNRCFRADSDIGFNALYIFELIGIKLQSKILAQIRLRRTINIYCSKALIIALYRKCAGNRSFVIVTVYR